MSSAIRFNVDQSKFLSSDDGLNASEGTAFKKHWLPAFFPFPTMFKKKHLLPQGHQKFSIYGKG